MNWQPSASIERLRQRAELFTAIRHFFAERKVLEVDTPALMRGASVDTHIESPAVSGGRHLHSSPELAMKRLLAAGSGSIYQLSHVFRANEKGQRHNPEFMMLEWYRTGLSTAQLQREISDLITEAQRFSWSSCESKSVEVITYQQAFLQYCGLDPLSCTVNDIRSCCDSSAPDSLGNDKDGWLDWLGSQQVFPHLGWNGDKPVQTYIVDFPVSQAALARIKVDDNGRAVADRFELYISGVELANGYHELSDVDEQRRRLGDDGAAVNVEFLAALESGLPNCAGVALGVDRLLMLLTGAEHISEVMPFDYDRI